MEYVKLNNGVLLPQLGLGTFKNDESILKRITPVSIKFGYQLFDTSPNYKNDVFLGREINKLDVDRKHFFICEKVDTFEQLNSIRQALERCLKRLNTDYIDMYLMHWPYPNRYLKTWKQMEILYKEGLVKTIGVCNFKKHHLSHLMSKATIIPAVNQIELHPLFTQCETVSFCKENNIQIMAYTPLARMNPLLIDNKLLNNLSKTYSKTIPQIILRWNIQQGFIVIPKSSNVNRIEENINIFDFKISTEDMTSISGLNNNFRVRFDPDDLSRYPNIFQGIRYRIKCFLKST